jgi:hypothetical protein
MSRPDFTGPRAESSTKPRAAAASTPVARASAPAVSAAVDVVREAAPVVRQAGVPSVAELTGRWDEIVERLRSGGKPMLASALSHATPVSITGAGVVTVALDEPNDIYAHSVNTGRAELLAAMQQWFGGVERVELRRDDGPAASPPKRLTDEMVRAERIASLKKRDPLLRAAIETLDLDVAD